MATRLIRWVAGVSGGVLAAGVAGTPVSLAEARSVVVTAPLLQVGPEGRARVEANVGGWYGLALEGSFVRDEGVPNDDGDVLSRRGGEVAVYLSRYSTPSKISGFYWGLGFGWRQMAAQWVKGPAKDTPQDALALMDPETEKITYEVEAQGWSAHGRIGYRYVPDSFPGALGIFVGMRHFQNKLSGPSVEGAEDGQTAILGRREQRSLQRRLVNGLEPGIELGVAF